MLDQKRTRYYNAQWQLLLERIDDNYNTSSGVNRDMLYVWGIRGMDDICVRIQNRNFGNDSPNVTYDDYWYHLTDTQFSTIAIIDRVGKLLERISYTAGGEARHHHRADLNGDGGTSSSELFTISTLAASGGGVGTGITSSSYNPNADIDCDGTIDSADYGLVSGLGAQAALRRGQISGAWVAPSGSNAPSSTDNIVGYCGYLFNAECGLYSVRFRVYDPVLMRWLTRDPIGYVDGANLYEYVSGDPIGYIDPLGLENNQPWYLDAFDWTLDAAANLGAGIADNLTFGGTEALRSATGVDDPNGISGADPNSGFYVAGNVGTTIVTAPSPKGIVTGTVKLATTGINIAKGAAGVGATVKAVDAVTDVAKVTEEALDLARSKITPRNLKLAGKTHPKTGIPFDANGWADFSSVAEKTVTIRQTGDRVVDFAAANKAAKLDKTPEGMTWHHHQDGTTMQLVPADIHAATGHTGGVAVVNGAKDLCENDL